MTAYALEVLLGVGMAVAGGAGLVLPLVVLLVRGGRR